MRKADSNHKNAQLSTGPRTEAGKVISSRNAISHAFQGGDAVLAHENAEHYNEVRTHYLAGVNQADAQELLLADQVTQAHWRLGRAQRLLALYHDLEVKGWSEADPSPDEVILRNMSERNNDVPATLYRHETHFQRLWFKIMNMLARRRSEALEAPRPEPLPAPVAEPASPVAEPAAPASIYHLPKPELLGLLDRVASGNWKECPRPLVQQVLRMPMQERTKLRSRLRAEISQTNPTASAA